MRIADAPRVTTDNLSMARGSLLFGLRMENTSNRNRSCCSYVVVADGGTAEEHSDLAAYLSEMNVAGCEVVVIDPSPRMQFEHNARILRWVGRHVPARAEHLGPDGSVDLVRAAASLAACEKVIVAERDVRYTADAIARVCERLEVHEAVEPQDYLHPLPWWGGIEAARILVHRGIEPQPDHGVTVAFRRSAIGALRMLAMRDPLQDPARRLSAAGAEVFPAGDVFVRRQPGELKGWLARRGHTSGDFTPAIRSAFFLSVIPFLVLLALFGSLQLAGGYAAAMAIGSVALAIRGRAGASGYFPWRACLLAPVWILERSVSVYWALGRRILGGRAGAARVAVPDGSRGEKVASGE